MASIKSLHSSLDLYITTDAYILRAPQGVEQLTISRKDGSMTLASPAPARPKTPSVPVKGVLGIASLATVDVLILIGSATTPVSLFGQQCFSAVQFMFFPLQPSDLLSDARDRHLIRLLQSALNQQFKDRIWFSYERDLTNSLDRGWKKRKGVGQGRAWEMAEDRFFWNRSLQDRFIQWTIKNEDQDLSRFILPVIFGSLEIRKTLVNSKPVLLCLTSRRSRHRAGTRYFTRGVDEDGHTANSNETEQIVIVAGEGTGEGGMIFSYVQTRGSVPVFWTQVNNLRYQPDLQVMEKPETAAALKAHIDDQIKFYGDLYLVNLVNQKGYEKPVKDAFERGMKQLNEPRAHYTYFDFHHECKGMKFERVSKLVDQLKPALDEQGFFQLSTNEDADEPVKVQRSIVRTNCMDSLDRTNVVQSALAKAAINRQFHIAKVIRESETIENYPEFMSVFRNVWADHADTISQPYSSTGALKTDFTRTGKRTFQGAYRDGVNSTIRYINNNFFDGTKQDAYDILTGAWDRDAPGAADFMVDRRPLAIRSMPWIMYFALFWIAASLIAPRGSNAPIGLVLYPMIGVLLVSLYYMHGNGIEYVSWPRLNHPSEIIAYEGPGWKSKEKGRGMDLPGYPGAKAHVKSQLEKKKLQ